MPSGWKCDLLFKNKIKELISKYGNDHAKIVKEIVGMCGVSESQAQCNLKAIKQLLDIEKTRDITGISQETFVKKLTPSILLEVAKTPEDKQQEVLKKIDSGELKTVKDVKEFRETGKIIQKKKKDEEVQKVRLETLQTDLERYSNRPILETTISNISKKLSELIAEANKENCTVIASRLFEISGQVQVFLKELKEIKQIKVVK